MLILLPPSETKRPGGAGTLDPATLRDAAVLEPTRLRVRRALVDVSRSETTAVTALKLGVKNRDEREHNLRLSTSGTLPAVERYTGVLYDALDVRSLEADARAWLDVHVAVQSALFGRVSAVDRIPAYRLSASSSLPRLGAALKRVWAAAHAGIDWRADGWVLDLRSRDYAALAPLPEGAGAVLDVVQRGPDGGMRALNHFNKAAKGDLVRRLACARPDVADASGLLSWAESEGLEMAPGEDPHRLTLITELGAPGAGRSAR